LHNYSKLLFKHLFFSRMRQLWHIKSNVYLSYHTWRTVEFVVKSDSSSRNSNANTLGLSINSRENGFLRRVKYLCKTNSYKKSYRQRAQLWLTLATPLTQRKQKECPQGNLTGLTSGCKHTLHSTERSELRLIIDILISFLFFSFD
jgi:hypothetical protein